MKTVWVAHDHGLGAGAELCLLESVRGLQNADHEVTVVVPAAGALADRLRDGGIRIEVVPYRWWVHSRIRMPVRRLWSNLRAAGEIARLLAGIRPDVVISNTLTIVAGALGARRARIPHAWYIHEFGREDHDLKFDLGAPLSLAIIRRLSSKVMVNSNAVRRKFRERIPECQLRVLPYAVDVPSCASVVSVPDEPFRLILVGRICEGKRQEDAVRALACLASMGLRPILTLLGNENAAYGAFLRHLAQQLEVAQQVEFLPFTDQPLPLVARAHAALICSRSEAFGRVTVEAMKQGKPVIGADAGGTSELIDHGVTGLLYRCMDPQDLCRKIEFGIRNRAVFQEMGQNALNWSRRNFNLQIHTQALVTILREAIHGGSPGRAPGH